MSDDREGPPPAQESLTAEDAFGLIGNETRAAILRVLGQDAYSVLSFSGLRSRVDADIDSGQFNYHLQRLVGHFVEQTEDGYQIRPQGRTLHRTIRAGTFTDRISFDQLDAGFACYFCETRVEAAYDDGLLTIQCPDCEHVYSITDLPPSAIDTDDKDALFSRIGQYSRHNLLAFARGVCPICANALDTDFHPAEEMAVPSAKQHHHSVFVDRSCNYCDNRMYMSVGEALLGDPGLISFCRDRGIDVAKTPTWELEFAATDRYVTVRSMDPWEVALKLTFDGDTLKLVVDDQLNVTERIGP